MQTKPEDSIYNILKLVSQFTKVTILNINAQN